MPKKKPKKTVKTVRFTTTIEPVTQTPPFLSISDQHRVLQQAHNCLLARHSFLHSTIESRALLLLDIQASPDHLTRLLDKLGLDRVPHKVGSEGEVLLMMPDNGRDPQLQRTTNGRDPAHTEIGTVKILPRDADEFVAPKGDRHGDDDINAWFR